MTGGSPATSEMVGRTCPYCRFGLELGVSVVACPVCKAVHHDDCWEENGGCAVALCAGGPSREQGVQEGDAEAVDPTPTPAPDPDPPPPLPPVEPLPSAAPTEKLNIPPAAVAPPSPARASSSPPPPPPHRGGSRLGWVPLIAAAIVLAGGGVAAAIVLSGDAGSSDATETSSTSEFEDEGEIGNEFEDEEEGFEEEEEFEPPEPTPSPAQRAQRQVQQALRAHFDRLAEGSYESAYYDLTADQRGEIGSESGWVEAHEEDQLESFNLSVDTSLTGSNSAEARILEFRTRALESGCKDWYGHWEMRKIYGEWLIDAAELEDEPC